METLSVVDAVRRLRRAAAANFAPYRGKNRSPEETVVSEFDLTFVVEGTSDACVSLLDYDVPRAHIVVYQGTNVGVAREAKRAYEELLQLAVGTAGAQSEYGSEHRGARCDVETTWYAGWGCGVQLQAFRREELANFEYAVWIEVPGTEVECIEGRPEDSILHILFAGTPLHADRTNRRPPPSSVRKPRSGTHDRKRKR